MLLQKIHLLINLYLFTINYPNAVSKTSKLAFINRDRLEVKVIMHRRHHMKHCHHQHPVICPPMCRYKDTYVEREVPYIHPMITINRQHVINKPKHYYEPITQNVVVDPGYMNMPNQMPYGGMNPYGYGRR